MSVPLQNGYKNKLMITELFCNAMSATIEIFRLLSLNATIYFACLVFNGIWNPSIGNVLVAGFRSGRMMSDPCTYKTVYFLRKALASENSSNSVPLIIVGECPGFLLHTSHCSQRIFQMFNITRSLGFFVIVKSFLAFEICPSTSHSYSDLQKPVRSNCARHVYSRDKTRSQNFGR